MIKFGEISKISEDNNQEVSGKYNDINPVGTMSDEEIRDFWDKEFERTQVYFEDEVCNDFPEEIFNCSEEKIEIDFVIDEEIGKNLEKFYDENWSGLNEDKQISCIKELTQCVGEKMGLQDVPGIVFFRDESSEYGAYNPENNLISLNKAYFDDAKELVDTITHELRHAYQYMRAEILETKEDRTFENNLNNYITPQLSPEGSWINVMEYQDQYVEVDARAFANIFTEAMK